MKTKKHIWRFGRHWMLAAGVLLAGGFVCSCEDEYDLDERTPDGWGASIYSWLDEQGNFTNTVRMIESLNYQEVLAKTGSKTLFVADDAAYERFYRNNPWGVSSYDQLTTAQKRLLLFGNMLDNSMQLSNLPSTAGTPPTEGDCMRRYSSTSIFDSVPVLLKDQMPDNIYWRRYRESNKPMVCMQDNTNTPLLFFIEKQLVNKKITNDDYNFLFNYKTNRQPGDASVNGVTVTEGNIRCSNGFIHRMAEVISPLPNMAEVIASKPNTSAYNELLERFCAPFPDRNPTANGSVTQQYNLDYGTAVDTVFVKRFFSEKSEGGSPVNLTPDGKVVSEFEMLKYDPEWNSYYAGIDEQGAEMAMQRNMGVMMVPSNEALDRYWNDGAGRVLKDYYGSWDKVPNDMIAELINVNMLESFIGSVPSKFDGILNDANDPMGVSVKHVDSVFLACNGAVYLTNYVYSPTLFISVLYPAWINETMHILRWGIQQCQYNVYLNSLNADYSFFIPTNKALLEYIDPVSYGKEGKTQLFRFRYDKKAQTVKASIWNYDMATRTTTDSIGEASSEQIVNRLRDILETHIVIGNVEDGHTYYRTKGGTEIRVNNVADGEKGMTVEGSFQINEGDPIPVVQIYDQTKDGGNGKAYILDGEPIMGTRRTVYDVLAEHEEFSKFYELMQGSALFERVHNKKYPCGGNNISVFNTYHYTVYVPTNESIEALQRSGKLSSWENVAAHKDNEDFAAATRDSLGIVNFLRYHIQDNALFIGAEPEKENFETSLMNEQTKRFYRLEVNSNGSGISIEDGAGNTRQVLTSDESLYNLMAREYQYNEGDAASASHIETTSSAVIHLIDGPLLVK